MKTRNIFVGFMIMALMILPGVAMASTYLFIDTSGNLQSVEATNSGEALDIAYRLGVHSGVMLVGAGTNTFTPIYVTGSNYYQFIDTNGNLQGVWASSPTEALNTAIRLGVHSGVILIK